MGTPSYSTIDERVKMFMFARWITTNYSNEDLNKADTDWWAEQLNYFNNIIYPEYLSNGSVEETRYFLINK
jgi:hypothetical protein